MKTSIPFSVLVLAIMSIQSSPIAANDALNIMRGSFRFTDGVTSGTSWVVKTTTTEKGHESQTFVLVSAAHTFQNFKGDSATIVMRKATDDQSYRRHEHSIGIRKNGTALWTKHPTLDIGVIKLELPDEVDVLPIEFGQLADEKFFDEAEFNVGQRCFLPCFPAQLESNKAGWPVLRSGTVASHPLSPAQTITFLLDYNSFGGDSGAPVIFPADHDAGRKHLTVVALILGQHRQTDKTVTAIEERTTHTSLGLGICLHSCFVRETIQTLLDQ